jgi:hypothetical protein
MTASSDLETAKSLGRLEGGMQALKELIGNLTDAIDADRAEAFRQREAQIKKMAEMEATLLAVKADMDAVKPLTEKWHRWQSIGFGVLLAVGLIGSVIGSALTYFHDQVIAFFK